ncbi:hypothetical protein EON63_21335 [archaeon]|nr:MAG: hypothetical protein EON63_21335 [archaeon]
MPYTIYHIPYTIHHIPYTIQHIPCIIHHREVKLSVFSAQDKEWKDLGKGLGRLVQGEGGKRRVLVRNTMGRVTLNANLYKTMKVWGVCVGVYEYGLMCMV